MHIRRSSAAELVLLGLVVLSSMAIPAAAEPQPRDVGIFADPQGTQSTLEVEGFSPFQVYVVGFELDGQVKGYEIGLQIPPGFTLLAWNIPVPCLGCFWPITDIRLGTGGCFDGTPTYRLLSPQLGWFGSADAPDDALLCVRPPDTQSPALNGRPGYLQCDGALVPFGYAQNGGEFYPDGCFVINPTHPLEGPVALEQLGIGALKSRFGAN